MKIIFILKAIQVLIFRVGFLLFDTKYLNPNEIREGFECLCKSGFSVLHVNIGV